MNHCFYCGKEGMECICAEFSQDIQLAILLGRQIELGDEIRRTLQ